LVTDRLSAFDSRMTNVSDPRNAPAMLTLGETIRDWRFYDHFRTDADAPVRSPQVGTWTPYGVTTGLTLARQHRPSAKIGADDLLDAARSSSYLVASPRCGGEHRLCYLFCGRMCVAYACRRCRGIGPPAFILVVAGATLALHIHIQAAFCWIVVEISPQHSQPPRTQESYPS